MQISFLHVTLSTVETGGAGDDSIRHMVISKVTPFRALGGRHQAPLGSNEHSRSASTGDVILQTDELSRRPTRMAPSKTALGNDLGPTLVELRIVFRSAFY